MKSFSCLSVLLAFVLILSMPAFTQEQEEDAHVYSITFLQVPFEQLDEFIEFHEKEVLSITKQVDEILSIKVYRHWWGPEWSIMEIQEFKDLSSMEIGLQKVQELRKKKYPDKNDLDKLLKKRRTYLNGHFDAIVREVIELRK